MASGRLPAGSWPVNLRSRNMLSSADVTDILTKVNGTKSSMKFLDGLQQEVSNLTRETTVSMFAVMRRGAGMDDVNVLRRQKAELREELLLTHDRLCITAEDVVKLQDKVDLLRSENAQLRRKLRQRNQFFTKSKTYSRSVAGDSTAHQSNIRRCGPDTTRNVPECRDDVSDNVSDDAGCCDSCDACKSCISWLCCHKKRTQPC